MYILLFSSLHEDDFGPNGLSGAVHTMIELVAAFCLGEVNISERTTQ
jgi:hypothetical protein